MKANILTHCQPQTLQHQTHKTAIAVHVYYLDLWPEIAAYLRAINYSYDLFITTTDAQSEAVSALVKQAFPQANIRTFPNEGMDILPFLKLMPELVEAGYVAVCKLHTKKGHDALAGVWRKLLLDTLVGDSSTVTTVMQAFAEDNQLAMIGSGVLYLSVQKLMYEQNKNNIQKLASALGIVDLPQNWGFFAGTMFWVKPVLLQTLADKTGHYFEATTHTHKADGGEERALESLLSLVPASSQQKLALLLPKAGMTGTRKVQTLQKKLDAQTLNQAYTKDVLQQYQRLVVDRTHLVKSGLFEYAAYLQQYPELTGSSADLPLHYLLVGRFQQATPHPDFAKANREIKNSIQNHEELKAVIFERGYFNPTTYQLANIDVAKKKVDPYIHYMETGWKENREGHSAIYDFNKYLALNKDVVRSGLNPIVHYITKGKKEGRRLFYVDQHLEKLNEKTPNVVAGYIERSKYRKINDSAIVIVSLTTEIALSNPKLINPNYDYISLGLPPQYTEADSIWSYRPIRYHLNDMVKLKAFVTINLAQQLNDYRRVIWSVNESYLNSREFNAALKQSESANHKILVAGEVKKFTNDVQNIAIKRFLSSVGIEVGNNEQVAFVEANFISYYMLSRKDTALLTKWWHFLAQNEIKNLIPISLFESIGCQILIEKSFPDISKLIAIDRYLSEMAAYFSLRSKIRTCFDKSIVCGESRVAVIVPVFNAIEDTKKCLRSVVESSYGNFHILIADDASEPDVQKWLQEFAEIHERVTLLKSKENSGYTINVNRAIKYCINDDYIVLLNSDTIVYGDWIQKLLQRFSDDQSVGIVGPLSNKAGWQSCPNLRGENELPGGTGLETINTILENGNHNLLCPEVDIVNGFCICISREVFDQIGLFDEESFPLGYGEEDDFCMRARLSGFKNVITLDTYVFHAKSKSMGHEKRLRLAKKGREVLDSRYDKSHYQQITSSIGENPILNTTRNDMAADWVTSFSVTSVIGEEVTHIKAKYSFDRVSQYKILIHFHCHYVGMCNYFAHYLRNIPFEYDLLITTSSDVEDKYFITCLKSAKMSKIDIVRVKNRGRDVYPFYYALKSTNAAEHYDFLLHIHTKKSVHDVLLGVNWISHMLACTLHSNNYIANLLELMMRENIGLAFPRVLEQHHRSYQWGKNKSIAINLALETGINTASLDRPFSFPAGFMFWVQPKYLNKLVCLELNDSSFPPEPIPIDGTLAHTLERMLPHFIEAEGGRVSPICVADSAPLDNECKFFSNNILTADDVEAAIIDAIDKSKSLSVIRYYDGEGAFFKAESWSDRYCKERMEYYFGSGDYSKQDAIDIRQTIMDSINSCDIIGIPNIDIVKQVITFAGLYCDWDFEKLPDLKRRLNKHIDCSSAWRIISAFQFVCTSLSSESKYTTKDIHYDLVRSGGLYRIIDAANDVRLITSQPVSPLLSKIFGKNFTCYDIPCRALDLEVSVNTKHYPSHNLLMRNKLHHIDFKGVVVLVGAGPLGKEYCSIIKNKGGIAIDIGAVFDSWINFLTRPEHSNGIGDIASDLLLTSENVTNLTQKAVRPKADVLVEDLPNAKRNPLVANVIN